MSEALKQLQDQIEAVRREAYAAGYAAGVREVTAYVSSFPGEQNPFAPSEAHTPAMSAGSAALRSPRGENKAKVLAVMKRLRGPVGVTTVQREIQGSGDELAYSSIRHALGQLATDGEIERTAAGFWKAKEDIEESF